MYLENAMKIISQLYLRLYQQIIF